MNISLSFISKNKLMALAMFLLSLMLAAYIPIHSANALISFDQDFIGMKKKTIQEIERRINNYKRTEKDLKDRETIRNKNAGPDGKNIAIPDATMQNVTEMTSQSIKNLEKIRDEVDKAQTIEELQKINKNLDEQYEVTQLINSQGAMTNALDSLTGATDKLKTTADGLKDKVNQIQQCQQDVNDGKTGGDAAGSLFGATGESDSAPESCNGLSQALMEMLNSGLGGQSGGAMGNNDQIMQQLQAIVIAIIALIISIVLAIIKVVNQLGGIEKLGELGKAENIGKVMSDPAVVASVSNIALLFASMASQMGIANLMAGNSQDQLNQVSGLINQ